jgi:putative YhbY family RNA-binding protein
MDELTPQQRRDLRAKAHHLHPVVSIGQHGLTPRVLNEIDIALTAHGLIKIRVHSDDRAAREAMLAEIAAQLHAAPVQHLGKLLIVWRERDEGEAQAPRVARKPAAHAKKSGTDRRTGPKAEKAAAARRPKAESTKPGNWRKRETKPKRPRVVEDEARGAHAPAAARRRSTGSGTEEPVADATRTRKRRPRAGVKTAPRGTFDDGTPREVRAAAPARAAKFAKLAGKPPRGGVASSTPAGGPPAPRRRRSG